MEEHSSRYHSHVEGGAVAGEARGPGYTWVQSPFWTVILKGRSCSGHPMVLHRPVPAARVLALNVSPLSPPHKSPLAKDSCLDQGHTPREQSSSHDGSVSGTRWKAFLSFRALRGIS